MNPGDKASNPVLSDEGKFIAFQMAKSRDAAGVGHLHKSSWLAFRPQKPLHAPPAMAFQLIVEDRLFQRRIQMLPEFSHAPATQQPQELLHIQQSIWLSPTHQLPVARPTALARMPHDSAPHHVQLHVKDIFL